MGGRLSGDEAVFIDEAGIYVEGGEVGEGCRACSPCAAAEAEEDGGGI